MKTVKLEGNSYFPQEEFVERLKSDFPEVFTEDSKVDLDKLKAAFGENADLGERYGLSWKGKSEVFRTIQETTTKTLKPIRDESVDFDNTDNLFIEGDNLEALKILQRSYYGKVKMIYIDPPYNTGNDFVYNDKFAEDRKEYEQEAGIRDGNGDIKEINGLRKNTKDGGHFHSNWLNMMYPRLYLARNLLRQDGVIFVSIDDNEVHNLRMIMNEIFGEENFIAQIVWQKKTGASDAVTISVITEYLLVYIKNNAHLQDFFSRNKQSYDLDRYTLKDDYLEERGPYYIDNLDRGGLQYSDSLNYPIVCPDGNITYPNGRTEFANDGWIWKWSKEKIEWARQNNFIEFRKSKSKKSGWAVCYKNYLNVDNEGNRTERSAPLKNLITDVLNANAASVIKEIFDSNIFQYSKPVDLIKKIISYIKTKNGDIVLDFFAGSGTTAHAVMQLNAEDGGNRRWIVVQLPEETEENSEARKAGYKNIADISKERIRRAAKKIEEGDNGQLLLENKDQDLGFKVFKVDQTNFKVWDASVKDPEKLEKQMQEMFDTVRDDTKEEDLLFELMIKSGIELTTPREQKDGYWKIGEGELIICLADKMTQELFNSILSEKPQKVILLDRAFVEDQLKKNLSLQAEKGNIEIVVV